MHKVWLACALQLKKCVSLAPLSLQHMQLAASLAVHNMLLASGQWHSCPGPGRLLSADPLRAAPGVRCRCAHLDITVVVQAPGLVLLAIAAGNHYNTCKYSVRPSAPPPLPTECTPAEQGSGTAAGVPVEPSVTRKPVLKRAAAPMLGGKLKAKVAKLPGKAAGNGRAAGMGNAAGAGRQAGASKAAGLRKHAAQVPASTGGEPAPQPAAAISRTSTAAEPAANADTDGSAKKSPPAGAPAKPRAKAADIDLAQTEVKLKEKQAACKLGELSIPQLKVLLKARKLLLGGKKADLITRLQGHLAGSQA
eukprot:jgi/Astpho2/2552/Aster-04263